MRKGKKKKKGKKEKRELKFYPYFVPLFNIGPYDRKKSCKKNREELNFIKIQGVGGKYFSGWP